MRTAFNFIKGQKIPRLGHVKRQEVNGPLRTYLEWISQGKRPRDRFRKRWFHVVVEYLEQMGVVNRKDLVQDRDECRAIAVAAETLRL